MISTKPCSMLRRRREDLASQLIAIGRTAGWDRYFTTDEPRVALRLAMHILIGGMASRKRNSKRCIDRPVFGE